mgnify:CR=1 FL=1
MASGDFRGFGCAGEVQVKDELIGRRCVRGGARFGGEQEGVGVLSQGAKDESPEPALGESLGERVNGDDTAQVDALVVPGFGPFRLGVIHGGRTEGGDPAEHEQVVSGVKLMLEVGEIPPTTVQPPGAVVDDALKDRASAVAPGFDSGGGDGATDSDGFAGLEGGDRAGLPPVFVSAGAEEEEIAHGMDLEPGEERGFFGADAMERMDGAIERTWSGSLHNGGMIAGWCRWPSANRRPVFGL